MSHFSPFPLGPMIILRDDKAKEVIGVWQFRGQSTCGALDMGSGVWLWENCQAGIIKIPNLQALWWGLYETGLCQWQGPSWRPALGKQLTNVVM